MVAVLDGDELAAAGVSHGDLQRAFDRFGAAGGAVGDRELAGRDAGEHFGELDPGAVDVRAKKATREQFAQVEAEILPLYKALAMDWAVASEQNYRKVKMGLTLNPNRRDVAADAEDM